MNITRTTRAWWWLVQKDLLREGRAPRAVLGMLLLGFMMTALLVMQIDLPVPQRYEVLGALFWIVTLFAGTVALDRSFANERDEGCWQALVAYPVPPATIFCAKLTVNFAALCGLDAVLAPAFAALAGVPFFQRPGTFLVVLLLANLGFAATGTFLSALTHTLSHRSTLLVLLLMPLVSPVLLGAAAATRHLLADNTGVEFSRWLQLLIGFDVLYVLLGALFFEFIVEE